jgi:hypothetical protein
LVDVHVVQRDMGNIGASDAAMQQKQQHVTGYVCMVLLWAVAWGVVARAASAGKQNTHMCTRVRLRCIPSRHNHLQPTAMAAITCYQ